MRKGNSKISLFEKLVHVLNLLSTEHLMIRKQDNKNIIFKKKTHFKSLLFI